MNKSDYSFIFIFGLVITIWFSLLSAPIMNDGLPKYIMEFSKVMDNPFKISFTNNTLKITFIFTIIYSLGFLVYITTRKNYRKGEEYGSAKWGNKKKISSKYKKEPITDNKILTRKVYLGLDGKIHRRNLNTLVIGGSGAGKTRFYAKPNIMQCNTSFVILDPKGEIVRALGGLLQSKGYNVKVLDLINMEKSHCYNPFVYLENDNDVQRLVTNLFKATTPKGSQSQDPFWDTAASMLLLALIFYLKYEAPEEEQNFPMVMEMLRAGDIKEDDDMYESPLDVLFRRLEERDPEHIALKYYDGYKSGADKTRKSILITLIARLEKFNLDSLISLTQTDELELQKLGEEKTALFALIPDNDTSFNFLVSILYTQLFQQLFLVADRKYGGSLKVPVHFVMDEFANVSLPNDFQQLLSVMRSRNIFVSIIIQNLSQLKALFEKDWDSIVGNCDEFLYLGGNEQSSHKYVSEIIGKESLDINTYGKSNGRSGNYSTNYQGTGRELITPDEVRRLDDNHCILLIRGEMPIKDLKYNILKHPNIKLTEDGGAKPFIHGNTDEAVATIRLDMNIDNVDLSDYDKVLDEYIVIDSMDLDDYFENERKM